MKNVIVAFSIVMFAAGCSKQEAFKSRLAASQANQSTPAKPTPVVSPTPTPSPGASASPTPSPTPTPSPANNCTLPPKPECGAAEGPAGVWGCCTAERSSFDDVVESAIQQFQVLRPDLFDGEKVKNEDAYVQGVAGVLNSMGYCASQGGPADEIGIKNSNGFNDQYDIHLSNGYIRHHGYQVTCRPARF